MTVNGPILPSRLGPTLAHEHLVVDLSLYAERPDDPAEAELFDGDVTIESLSVLRYNPYAVRENCVIRNTKEDIEFLSYELKRFADLGGRTVVDMTLDGFGRDVSAAKEISDRSGVQVISGCGNYVKASHPAYVSRLSVKELADKYIGEILHGVGDTGICPGVIGELGTSGTLFEDEIKVLRAAACAQADTGLPINVHIPCAVCDTSKRILEVLAESGADLEHVILSHRCGCLASLEMDYDAALDYLTEIAEKGCYVEFDLAGCIYPYFTPKDVLWSHADDRTRAKAIADLRDRGFGRKILLSHDACYRFYYSSYGGWAMTHVLTVFKRILQESGISEADFEDLMVNNPAEALVIK